MAIKFVAGTFTTCAVLSEANMQLFQILLHFYIFVFQIKYSLHFSTLGYQPITNLALIKPWYNQLKTKSR